MPIKQLDNKIKVAEFIVKVKDIFNLVDFYDNLKDWLLEYGWSSVDGNGIIEGKEYWETLYLERRTTGGFTEHWWWWRMQKVPTSNSYYKYHLDVDFHTVAITPTEVMRDGKKFKAHKGEVEVKVWAYIEFDYKGEWSSHPILKMFNKVFPERIFRKELYETHRLELYREIYIFQAYIKKWMKIKNFLPFEEITPFHPSKAYPTWKKE